MKFYFIRHWRTKFNLTGQMVKNYDDVDIVSDYPDGWQEKVGKFVPDTHYILSSPVKRCKQTCKLLFNKEPLGCLSEFGEFDFFSNLVEIDGFNQSKGIN